MKRRIAAFAIVLFCISVRADPIAFNATGMVTDESGKPIAGATVELARRVILPHAARMVGIDVVATTRSDASGAFKLAADLPDKGRDAWIRASAPGRAPSAISIVVSRDPFEYFDYLRQTQIKEPWLILLPPRRVRGIVVNEQDQPVAGCRVQTGAMQEAIVTGGDGAFEVTIADTGESGFSATGRIAFDHADYVTCEIRVPFESPPLLQPDGSLKVQLETGVMISGRVTAEGDRPLAANISMFGTGRQMIDIRERFFAAVNADEQGKFSVRVPTRAEIHFTPSAREEVDGKTRYYDLPTKSRNETFSQDSADVNFELQKLQHAAGIVKFPPGVDPRKFGVTASSSNSAVETVTCRRDGKFEFSQLPPGSYELSVKGFGDSNAIATGSAEIAAGQDFLGIELRAAEAGTPLPTLRGKVLNPDGTPAVLAVVRFHSIQGFRNARPSAFTELDGRFEMPNFTAGEALWLWVASSTRESAQVLKFGADFDDATPIEINLSPTATITGKVVDSDDKPIAGAIVSLMGVKRIRGMTDYSDVRSTRSDADGKYAIKGLLVPDGVDDLEVHARITFFGGELSGHKVTELKPGETLGGLNFRIRDAGGRTEIIAEQEAAP